MPVNVVLAAPGAGRVQLLLDQGQLPSIASLLACASGLRGSTRSGSTVTRRTLAPR